MIRSSGEAYKKIGALVIEFRVWISFGDLNSNDDSPKWLK